MEAFRTFANTDGWGNKLVTIFARHLDSFVLTNNFSLIFKIRDPGSGQILQPGQLYHSPGLAKIAPYPPCTVTTFWPRWRGVPGFCPVLSSGNVYYHNRRAVSFNLCRDLGF
jgi:hypothetical protein